MSKSEFQPTYPQKLYLNAEGPAGDYTGHSTIEEALRQEDEAECWIVEYKKVSTKRYRKNFEII